MTKCKPKTSGTSNTAENRENSDNKVNKKEAGKQSKANRAYQKQDQEPTESDICCHPAGPAFCLERLDLPFTCPGPEYRSEELQVCTSGSKSTIKARFNTTHKLLSRSSALSDFEASPLGFMSQSPPLTLFVGLDLHGSIMAQLLGGLLMFR